MNTRAVPDELEINIGAMLVQMVVVHMVVISIGQTIQDSFCRCFYSLEIEKMNLNPFFGGEKAHDQREGRGGCFRNF